MIVYNARTTVAVAEASQSAASCATWTFPSPELAAQLPARSETTDCWTGFTTKRAGTACYAAGVGRLRKRTVFSRCMNWVLVHRVCCSCCVVQFGVECAAAEMLHDFVHFASNLLSLYPRGIQIAQSRQ